jgi:proline dehydrogenase
VVSLDRDNGIIGKVAYGLSRKYVAGTTTSSMLKKVREVNDRGWHATVTLLNDHVTDISKAKYNTNAYSQVVRELTRLHLYSDISVRPSQLGYRLDGGAFLANLSQLGKLVNGGGTRVWLEHEEGVDQREVALLYKRMKKSYSMGIEVRPGQGGSDIEEFIGAGDSVRVCYDNRFKHEDSPKLYSGLVDSLCGRKAKVMLASNDTRWMRAMVKGNEAYRKSLMFEIPLGYSVRRLNGLAKGRDTLSLYVPYGKDWAPYIVNRLAEGKMRSIAAKLLGNINDEINGRGAKDA